MTARSGDTEQARERIRQRVKLDSLWAPPTGEQLVLDGPACVDPDRALAEATVEVLRTFPGSTIVESSS